MKSIMITSRISCKLNLERIQRELRRYEQEYELEYSTGEILGWKEWHSNEESAKGISNKKVVEIVSDVLQ